MMPTQAWRYSELLGAACGVDVQLVWSGRPIDGAWGGWVVQWRDGPTETQMRTVATNTLPAEPCVATGSIPPAAELSYSRCLSTVGEATALLIWLEGHPEALRAVGAVHLVAARDDVPYPERADDLTRRRADALLGRSTSGAVGYDVLRELAGRGRCGWASVTSWLDAGCAAPMVADLASERARRRIR